MLNNDLTDDRQYCQDTVVPGIDASLSCDSVDPVDTLAARVRRMLALKGWSQNRLEIEAGLSGGAANRACNSDKKVRGKRPSAGTLLKIAQALKVDLTWLQTGDGEPPPGYAQTPDPDPPERAPEPIADRYPNRALVRQRPWYGEMPAKVRDFFEAIREQGGDHHAPERWFEILQKLDLEYAAKGDKADFVRVLFPSASESDGPKKKR